MPFPSVSAWNMPLSVEYMFALENYRPNLW